MSDDNGDEFDAVVGRVRERVRPDRDERERLRRVVAALRDRTEAAVADLPVDAGAVEIVQVGSTARDTWLSGERDVDLFVCFPPDLERAELESYGLEVGHAVLPDGHEEYAEHPYVRGEYDGFAVDLVPCYAVDDATATQSAVDRTPFHTRYLAERMDAFDEGEDDAADRPIADEIRVAKRFLTGIGVYGSDLRTRGFSGYLTELLVLEYGDFRAFVEAAADWHPPVELDPGDHARESFDDPLVVIDPTDPERNVAAVCTDEAVATLQHYARELLADPRESLFDPADPDPLSAADVRERFADRGTTPIAVRFDAPEVVEDQLYPQLAKSLDGLAGELDRRGFDVLRSAAWAGERAVLLFELEVADRPAVERHEGPPVDVRDHAEGFFETYADDPDVYGPFVDGDRYVVERERDHRTAATFLDSDAVFDVALGAQVEEVMAAGYDVLVDDAVADLADEFGVELARYLNPLP